MENKNKRKHSISFDPKEGKTKSEFAKSSNINVIMANAQRGMMPNLSPNPQQYADVSEIGDYQESLIKVTKAQQAFKALDPKIRSRFKGNPQEMLAFLQDPKNRKEAEELGLIPQVPGWMKSDQEKPSEKKTEEPKSEPKGD